MLTVVGVEWSWLRGLLGTAPLTFDEWLAVLGWSLVLPIVIELYKAVRRKQAAAPADSTNLHNILPDRVLSPGDHRSRGT